MNFTFIKVCIFEPRVFLTCCWQYIDGLFGLMKCLIADSHINIHIFVCYRIKSKTDFKITQSQLKITLIQKTRAHKIRYFHIFGIFFIQFLKHNQCAFGILIFVYLFSLSSYRNLYLFQLRFHSMCILTWIRRIMCCCSSLWKAVIKDTTDWLSWCEYFRLLWV